jgi:hypothetical protein
MNRIFIIFCCVFSLGVIAVNAQPPDDNCGEFFVGYALNRMDLQDALDDRGIRNSLGGWNSNGVNVSVGGHVGQTGITDSISILGDFSAHYGKLYGDRVMIYTATVGPQFTSRKHKVLHPFVRALFGVSHIDGDLGGGITDSTGFAFILGGGFDAKLSKNFGLRIAQLDFVGMRHESVTIKNFRFATGLAFTW